MRKYRFPPFLHRQASIKCLIIQNLKLQTVQIIQILGVIFTPNRVNRMRREFAKLLKLSAFLMLHWKHHLVY